MIPELADCLLLLEVQIGAKNIYLKPIVRPPLNKKLFPVYRPGESKRADWNFFSHLFKKKIFFLLFPLYILVFKKIEIRKQKNPDLPTDSFFPHPAHRKQFFT